MNSAPGGWLRRESAKRVAGTIDSAPVRDRALGGNNRWNPVPGLTVTLDALECGRAGSPLCRIAAKLRVMKTKVAKQSLVPTPTGALRPKDASLPVEIVSRPRPFLVQALRLRQHKSPRA